jgi:hypothetical protein
VVSGQVALECFAHDWDFNPRIVPALYWSFVHVPAHLLMTLLVSLVAFACVHHGPTCVRRARRGIAGRAESADSTSSSSGVEAPEERLVLGLFRKSSNFYHLIQDTEPILLVVLYTLWPEVTVRTLRIPSCIEMPDVDGIWKWWLTSDPDMPCWESEHLGLVLIAGCGFAAWSMGPLLYICLRVWRCGMDKYTPNNLVSFGYFYTGLAPQTWWRAEPAWEIAMHLSPTMSTSHVAFY